MNTRLLKLLKVNPRIRGLMPLKIKKPKNLDIRSSSCFKSLQRRRDLSKKSIFFTRKSRKNIGNLFSIDLLQILKHNFVTRDFLPVKIKKRKNLETFKAPVVPNLHREET
jgi:hypothetical protein